LIGGGYGAILHLNGYKRVHGVDVCIKTLVDVDVKKAKELQKLYGIQNITTGYDDVLKDPEIDIIDIVTPPALHADMVYQALMAGKHIICEKPFTGYFGKDWDQEPIGLHVPKRRMYETV